jgi:hypothetical protein
VLGRGTFDCFLPSVPCPFTYSLPNLGPASIGFKTFLFAPQQAPPAEVLCNRCLVHAPAGLNQNAPLTRPAPSIPFPAASVSFPPRPLWWALVLGVVVRAIMVETETVRQINIKTVTR